MDNFTEKANCLLCGTDYNVTFSFNEKHELIDCTPCPNCGEKDFTMRVQVGDPKKWIGICGTIS